MDGPSVTLEASVTLLVVDATRDAALLRERLGPYRCAEPTPPWLDLLPSDPIAASRVLVAWLDASRCDPAAPLPPLGTVAEVLIRLIQYADAPAAARLHAATFHWLQDCWRTVGDAAATDLWLMAAELWTVHTRLPREVRVSIARALLVGEPGLTRAFLRRFVDENPYEASQAREMLEREAPALLAMFGSALADAPREPAMHARSLRAWHLVTVGFAVVACVVGSVRAVASPQAEGTNAHASRAARAVAAAAAEAHLPVAARRANLVADALDRDDCEAARGERLRLTALLADTSPLAEVRVRLDVLDREMDLACEPDVAPGASPQSRW